MIKTVLIVVGLSLGAVVGLLQGGRIGHLNALPGLDPPPWMGRIAPDAGLGQGHATLDWGQVTWKLRFDGVAVPAWQMGVAAPGVDAAARLHPTPGHAEVMLTRTAVNLPVAVPLIEDLDLSGDLLLTDGAASVPWATRHLEGLSAEGRVIGLTWQGHALGAFDLRLEMTRPVWRATFNPVPGNPVDARMTLNGLSGGAALQLDLRIADTPSLPPDLKRILQRVVPSASGSWRIERRLPLGRPLP